MNVNLCKFDEKYLSSCHQHEATSKESKRSLRLLCDLISDWEKLWRFAL